ncbi:MAG: phosphoribosylamine--glycine ligase [Candidatus Thermoplasmatota archaeon]|nr:phosphoribosylamine--glycine ligase [Candidatus Thermoplasmatota archaeon]
MKILIIGSGGREHALAWKVRKSRWVTKVYCAPGNAGISQVAECVPVPDHDVRGLLEFARAKEIDLTIVGPEAPLAMGIVDVFKRKGLKIFGPTRAAARIESSKAYAKFIMEKYEIPTAKTEVFTRPQDAKRYIKNIGGPLVVKVDGLAAGKGAIPCEDEIEALKAVDRIAKGEFGEAGSKILIEEYLVGEEASILAFSDGRHVIPLESAQDHKRAYDDDKGPNTGGMGAYSPAPVITKDLESRIYDEILLPTIRGLASEGCRYTGILYVGLMITNEGPKVIEFNCRFGDPEAQAILPRMASDFIKPVLACIEGKLDKVKLRWSRNCSVNVVMASGGYPGKYEKGKVISGLEKVGAESSVVFHSGTGYDEAGRLITKGGRVLSVTSLAPSIQDAIHCAYQEVGKIEFEGVHYRKDIARRALYHMEDM